MTLPLRPEKHPVYVFLRHLLFLSHRFFLIHHILTPVPTSRLEKSETAVPSAASCLFLPFLDE